MRTRKIRQDCYRKDFCGDPIRSKIREGIQAGVAIWYNTWVISRGKEMPQYLKQDPSLLTKVVDYLVVCVNDFADAHGLSYPDAHEYLSKYRGLAFLVDCYEAEHLLSLDEALDDIRQICRQNGGTI